MLFAVTINRRTAITVGALAFIVLASLLVNAYLLRSANVALATPLGSSTISIDGTLSDWGTSSSPVTGMAVSEDGSDVSPDAPNTDASDLNFF